MAIYTRGAAPETPSPAAAPSTPGDDMQRMTHVVARGESLFSIGKRYNVGVQDLMSWNNRGSSKIMAGERLVIYTPRAPGSQNGAQ